MNTEVDIKYPSLLEQILFMLIHLFSILLKGVIITLIVYIYNMIQILPVSWYYLNNSINFSETITMILLVTFVAVGVAIILWMINDIMTYLHRIWLLLRGKIYKCTDDTGKTIFAPKEQISELITIYKEAE